MENEPDVFWGAYFEPKEKYEAELEVGAENWRKDLEIENIDIEKALKKGKWQQNVRGKRYDSLREFLAKHGWFDVGN